MKIEILDDMGMCHVITSRNLSLVGEWFKDTAVSLMSADTRYNHPLRVDIWPQDQEESKLIGQHSIAPVTQDDLLSLAGSILETSQMLGDLEAKARDAQ